MTPSRRIKLYNAGSFFDPRAVPESDYDDVAAALAGLSRVIVESHPALVGPRVDRLIGSLERHAAWRTRPAGAGSRDGAGNGASGSARPAEQAVHARGFADAADALARRGVALRVFLLISPPFVPFDEQDEWLRRSVDAAFDCGASVVSLVPTRPGNGTMEALAELGEFTPPGLDDIERSFALALDHAQGRGRVFVDLWDLERFAGPTAQPRSDCARAFTP